MAAGVRLAATLERSLGQSDYREEGEKEAKSTEALSPPLLQTLSKVRLGTAIM